MQHALFGGCRELAVIVEELVLGAQGDVALHHVVELTVSADAPRHTLEGIVRRWGRSTVEVRHLDRGVDVATAPDDEHGPRGAGPNTEAAPNMMGCRLNHGSFSRLKRRL
jgi:hypothetical protein